MRLSAGRSFKPVALLLPSPLEGEGSGVRGKMLSAYSPAEDRLNHNGVIKFVRSHKCRRHQNRK
jgi:hypothetical protein